MGVCCLCVVCCCVLGVTGRRSREQGQQKGGRKSHAPPHTHIHTCPTTRKRKRNPPPLSRTRHAAPRRRADRDHARRVEAGLLHQILAHKGPVVAAVGDVGLVVRDDLVFCCLCFVVFCFVCTLHVVCCVLLFGWGCVFFFGRCGVLPPAVATSCAAVSLRRPSPPPPLNTHTHTAPQQRPSPPRHRHPSLCAPAVCRQARG